MSKIEHILNRYKKPRNIVFDAANYFTGYRFYTQPERGKIANASAFLVTGVEIFVSIYNPKSIDLIIVGGETLRPVYRALSSFSEYIGARYIVPLFKKQANQIKSSNPQ